MSNLRRQLVLLVTAGGLLTCGEGPTGPDRRVAAVLTSRDSVYLDVADSVLLRAEARDQQGDPIPEATFTWLSLDGGVATATGSGSTGRVVAVAPGTSGVVASSDGHADTTAVTAFPPIISTSLASHADTAWALGDTLAVLMTSQSASGPRFGHYDVVSRSTGVLATLDPAAHVIRVIAQLPGQAYVVVTEHRGSRDSVLVVVRQRPTQLIVTPDALIGFQGRSAVLTASVRDARNNPIPGQAVAWSSSDTAIAGVDSAGLVSYRSVGTARIIAHAAGPADTTPVTVQPKPKLSLSNLVVGHSHDSLEVGAFQLGDTFYAYADNAVSPWVHLRVVDTSVATAPDSVMYVGVGGTFNVRGRRAGRTLLIGDAPLLAPDTVRIHVSTPRLHLNDPVDPVPLAIRGTDNVRFGVTTTDSSGTPHLLADTLVVTFRSSDSSIIDLFQNRAPYSVIPGPSEVVFSAHALDTGRAVVRATAPGFLPDSMPWRVLPGPKLRFMQGRAEILGAGQSTVELRQLASVGPEASGDTVLVTLTNRRPATAAVPSGLTLTGFTGTGLIASYSVDALQPGTDTIIATAAGHEPDTAVIIVTTPQILLPDTVHGTTLGAGMGVAVGDSLGVAHAPTDALLLLATSSDTNVARGSSTRIPARLLGWSLGFPAVDTGSATMTVRDSAGRYPPKLVNVRFALDSSLHVGTQDGYQYGPAATQQRFESNRFFLNYPYFPEPRAVHLSLTAPGVLRVPDSVLVVGSGYAFFAGVGGDFPGTTRIVATLHGFRPDTSVPITVGRGHLTLEAPTTAWVGRGGYVASVHARSPGGVVFPDGVEFPMDQNLTVTLVPIDPGVAPQSTSLTVLAGQAVSPSTALEFTTAGPLRLAAEDRRAVPAPFLGDTVVTQSRVPPLSLSGPSSGGLTVGAGQRLAAVISRPYELVAESVMVDVSHRGSRSSSAPRVLLPVGVTAAPYAINGLAIGTDAVTLAAPGYASDTITVSVTEGRVTLAHWPGALRIGESVSVVLQIGDSAGVGHVVVDSTTFAIEASGGIQVSDGARSITEITVPAGSGQTRSLYVKGTATGSASLTFTNLYYAPGVFTTSVTAAPAPARP